MKVLILVEGAPRGPLPGGVGWGGFSRYWIGALRQLQAAGVEVTFVSLREESPLTEEVRSLGIETTALRSRSRADLVLQIRRLRKLMTTKKIDVIHGNEAVQAALATVAGKGLEVGTVFHRHHVEPIKAQRWFSHTASRMADVTIAVSNPAADVAIREGCPQDNVWVVHNGIPEPRTVGTQEIADARASLGIAPDDVVLTLVGHLRPEKGHTILFDAMRRLPSKKDSSTYALIVGGGAAEEKLKQECKDIARQLRFLGHQDDVALWNAVGDIAVVPSLDEPFGLVALEGMAMSRPVVASRVGGLIEIVKDGETGLFSEPGDASMLAASIDRLRGSASTRSALGAAGRRRFLDHFTEEAMVRGWIRSYEAARSVA